ncbi:MAG: PAS domain S-box protein [Deltaproteobacteria bacterium]|uniref:PAS domain S-box protein n=1 Tax=Desulfobacula sp. TaxID=2593537 RepID=UPI0019A763EF|nr:PAS domain S-box protein [Candidatus Desulfobacula maris]MBL6995222.1 PAS domain S-box protein [Desulfobacula sp.]
MDKKPTYEELEKRVQELEKIGSEQKLVEEKLFEEIYFSQTLLQAAPVFFVAINAEGKTIMVNETMLHSLGYKQEEVVGKDYLTTFVPEKNREELSKIFDKLIQQKKPTLNENFIMTKDGKELLIEWHGRSIFNKKGEFSYFFGLGIDITERKQVEEKLRESEERYRSIFENAVEGLFQSTPEGRFISVNPSFARMLGYASPEELVSGTSDITKQYYVNNEDRQRYEQLLQTAGFVENFEYRVRCKDGSHIWVSDSTRAIYDRDGKTARYEGYVTDITERKRVDEALQESEDKYRIVVENATDAILVAQDGVTKFSNRRAEELTGYSAEELSNTPFIDFVHPNDKETVLDRYRRRLKGENPVNIYSFRIIHKSGLEKTVQINAVLFQWEDRPATLIFLRDITDRKKSENALRESETKNKALQEATFEALFFSVKGVCIEANNSASQLFGYKHDEFIGILGTDIIADEFKTIVKDKMLSGYDQPYEAIAQRKDGSKFWAEFHGKMFEYQGKIIRVTSVRDITDQMQAKQELKLLNLKFEHEATHDPLTGASNRRAILDRLSGELVRAKRGNLKLSIGLCDIDHFKHVNDKYGHQVGDDVLCNFVKTVQNTLRPYDLVGRYGGEEFLLVIPELPASSGLVEERIYERVRARIADHKMVTRSGEVGITISIGITSRSGDETADAMIAKADAALYRAKENGRNQLAFSD